MVTIQCPTARPSLQLNASGQVVSDMQTALNLRLKELDTASVFPLQVPMTGFFGEQTRTAVQYFQCLAFLKVDGVVGAKTWAYLCEGSASMPVLRRGAVNDLVEKVQKVLKDFDLYRGALDGNFGLQTETAVKAFQKNLRLSVDGVIGAQTWTALSRFEFHSKACLVDHIGL
jgi:peptidoglycan hydrolase-like protein with peptidoglycan-binding domain